MSEARDMRQQSLLDTKCTFKGFRVFLEGADGKDAKAFRRFSHRLALSRFASEDIKKDK